MSRVSAIEQRLLWLITDERLPAPERELRFDRERKWRFDFAWPEQMLAVECEGGIYTRGRHTRPQGFIDDCEKYNRAAMLGWRVLRFPMDMVNDGRALETIKGALQHG